MKDFLVLTGVLAACAFGLGAFELIDGKNYSGSFLMAVGVLFSIGFLYAWKNGKRK